MYPGSAWHIFSLSFHQSQSRDFSVAVAVLLLGQFSSRSMVFIQILFWRMQRQWSDNWFNDDDKKKKRPLRAVNLLILSTNLVCPLNSNRSPTKKRAPDYFDELIMNPLEGAAMNSFQSWWIMNCRKKRCMESSGSLTIYLYLYLRDFVQRPPRSITVPRHK